MKTRNRILEELAMYVRNKKKLIAEIQNGKDVEINKMYIISIDAKIDILNWVLKESKPAPI